MFETPKMSRSLRVASHFRLCLATCFMAAMLLPTTVRATENGGGVYPIGADTLLPGLTPPPNGSVLAEFSLFYSANQAPSTWAAPSTEFKLRLLANAVKLVHNCDIPVLGGSLNSNIVVPGFYEKLHVAPGIYNQNGLGNVIFGVFIVGYQKDSWHWFYEGDAYVPGIPYSQTNILNTGQHNYAMAPVAGFTFLPHHGEWEVSSKAQYIVNFHDLATSYHSGNESTLEYDVMRQVSRKAAVGINGYFYKQTTDDLLSGVRVGDGNRGRDLAIGPEARFALGAHGAFAFKYFRDTLVENKACGNAFWFELGVPLRLGMGGGK